MSRYAIVLLGAAIACTGKTITPDNVTQAGKPRGESAAAVATVRTTLEGINDKIDRWVMSGQADSVRGVYAADAVGMYANQKAVVGRHAIVEYWKGVTSLGKI